MLSKVIHKFYLIGGILGLLLLGGYAQLAFFLHYESQSAVRGQQAVFFEREIRSLEDTFFQIRFWEKSVLSQDHPEAEKRFGLLMEQMNKRLETLKAKPIDKDIEEELRQASNLVKRYEREFNHIIQLKTEQRLGETLFDSNYQSLISNVFRSNEISLLKPLFNLSHFQRSYLSHHRESEYQALTVVMGSLENRLLRKDLLDERLRGYTETYKKFLKQDFSLEKKIQELSNDFDEISIQLTSLFFRISAVAGKILENEIHTAEDLRSRLNQSFIISMALGMLGVLLIFTFMARQIVHPIRAIAEVARHVRSGKVDARFDSKGSQRNEVVRLGWDLNDMLDTLDKKNEQLFTYQKQLESKVQQLAHREDELQKHRHDLEELVKERTRDLQDAQEELVRKERLATLGQLSATVSHELRNPLGTLRSSVFTLRERILEKDPRVERVLDRADRSIDRCDRIIGDLLDYTRIRDLIPVTTGIDEWLGELLTEQTMPDGISLFRDLAAGREIPLDRERFRRCLINVIDNANEAIMEKVASQEMKRKDAGVEQLAVETRTVDDRLVVRVTDTGPGISPDELERVFEPLYSTKSFGAGLGLPIVQQIMEQHGGGIDIESELGKGTAVMLWLPVLTIAY